MWTYKALRGLITLIMVYYSYPFVPNTELGLFVVTMFAIFLSANILSNVLFKFAKFAVGWGNNAQNLIAALIKAGVMVMAFFYPYNLLFPLIDVESLLGISEQWLFLFTAGLSEFLTWFLIKQQPKEILV